MQQPLRFSTDVLPERDRLAIWREVFGRYVVMAQVEPAGDGGFSQTATLRELPGLSLGSFSSTGYQVTRTKNLVVDGNDNLVLIINSAGRSQFHQLGREAVLASHEGVLMSNAEQGSGIHPGASRHLTISAPRRTLVSMVRDPEAIACRPLPRSEVLRLLISYIQSTDSLSLDSPGLGQAFATHLQDLMVLAIGATSDGEEVARGRGLRAARLVAIKLDIGRSLGRNDLSIGALALRHGVTTRYVQKLFESDGATFTEYVIERRLLEARRMLTDPRFAGHSIGDIALKAGFGDLPYFTRSFRRRFGMTPSDAREQARREPE
ncbi:transcriptional regulator, AraC family [Bradyrhizobium lablabi]|uniref:Transcriptional regulator, AraC family n=1 Tax=Bradyrhizobium lablabi TaxID=722472 RepID=A0A1M6Z8A3_9BRAD|nr:AraC family transcriptional regulator [Bradyrhizobium lablabi]SHL26668.1 transcriptional regulator, AraC family [Bradyrhizobium lablabi]